MSYNIVPSVVFYPIIFLPLFLRTVFSVSHFPYEAHSCSNNVQVPTCPLCDKPVPTPRGVSPDVQVNEHIINNCALNKKKIFANRCSVKGCKKKELVPITCPSCQQNFCLGHRHEKDHNCERMKSSPKSGWTELCQSSKKQRMFFVLL
ncbi:unnamed protein product [Heligmosomoides polygyrus]|uniref:AN1-type domain-containing protein n=1 Tax=Heligmosomoides polygyrus TaxID=6339 RepID=A0A3P8AH20_HELPZ|nr:unnamed protein product [Heligmosomoides polygyrus]